MATMADVAKKAGVSISTVSLVLNGTKKLSDENTRAVEEAAAELGYTPRAVRPGPKPKSRQGTRTGKVLFLSVNSFSVGFLYRKPVYPKFLEGIHRALHENDLELIMAPSPDAGAVPRALLRKEVDGVLLSGREEMTAPVKKTVEEFPAVWCFNGPAAQTREFDYVFYDNSMVSDLALRYLTERGHRNLAYADFQEENPAIAARRKNFLQAVKNYDATVEMVAAEDVNANRTEKGREIVKRLLAINPRPTGVFAATDARVLSLYTAFRENGVEPERDITLIGCNNEEPVLRHMHPRPATIDIKVDTVGQRSVMQLLWRMANPTDVSRSKILIPPVVTPGEIVAEYERQDSERRKTEIIEA